MSKHTALARKPPPAAPAGVSWDVEPTHVILKMTAECAQGTADPTRIKIKNRSLASLMFDVVWPGHYLTITPNRGRVEPE